MHVVSCSDMLAHVAQRRMPGHGVIHTYTFNSNLASIHIRQWISFPPSGAWSNQVDHDKTNTGRVADLAGSGGY